MKWSELPDDVIDQYRAGKPLAELGRKYGCSGMTIRRKLQESGEAIRPVGSKPRGARRRVQPPSEKELRRLRDKGLSTAEIAGRYGHQAEWARRWMVRYGIDRLPAKARPERNHFWSGGRTQDRHGYVLAKMPKHPRRNRAGYVREHRLVLEAHLGRLLEPSEVVDHRNGTVDDNSLGNLQLFPTNADHLKVTLAGRKGNRRSRLRRQYPPDGPTPTATETGAEPLRRSHPLGPWPHGTTEPDPS